MDRRIIALSSLACLPFLGISSVNAEEAKNPFSANVTLTSDYAYRGISQTDERPAIQGGFDFKHDSGFYAGTWAQVFHGSTICLMVVLPRAVWNWVYMAATSTVR